MIQTCLYIYNSLYIYIYIDTHKTSGFNKHINSYYCTDKYNVYLYIYICMCIKSLYLYINI